MGDGGVRPTSERGWTARIAAHGGEREALRSDGRVLDQATLVAGVEALAARLAGVGIEAGDLVAVLAPPSVEGVMLVHAFLDRGVVLLPLNARLGEAELDYVMASSGAGWLFAAHDEARAAGLAERADCGLVRFGPDLEQADGVAVAVERQPRIDGHEQDAAQRAALCAQDAALVLYTSGTSGRPKGAVLGFDSLMASAAASTELLGSQPDDRWLLCMPLFHVGGLSILTRAALAGTSVVLHERFDPQRVSEALDAERITQLTFVATMLARLLEVRGARRAPESLRFVLVGGGPAPQPLLERARALGFPLAPTYGLTETASQAATRPPDAPVASEDDLAAGLRALPGVEIRVVDRARRPLGVGEEGEIEVRGPIVMAGYLGDPEATARVLHEGWLATGDIGRLDASGGLRVLDRRTDLVISGGENVYPAEVESVLDAHPDVVEAGVAGVADESYGERPMAWVVWRGGAGRAGEVLAVWCRERLAGYKRPVGFVEVESLPRTASGKLIRRSLASLPPARR
jgi:O-succinylbenzoic acid--CoA ligase